MRIPASRCPGFVSDWASQFTVSPPAVVPGFVSVRVFRVRVVSAWELLHSFRNFPGVGFILYFACAGGRLLRGASAMRRRESGAAWLSGSRWSEAAAHRLASLIGDYSAISIRQISKIHLSEALTYLSSQAGLKKTRERLLNCDQLAEKRREEARKDMQRHEELTQPMVRGDSPFRSILRFLSVLFFFSNNVLDSFI